MASARARQFVGAILSLRSLLVLLAMVGAASAGQAAEAIGRLVGLVGSDAGLCVEIPQLDKTASAFVQGEFFRRVQTSEIYAHWRSSEEYQRLERIAGVIQTFSGKSAREFARELFGTNVVVAVYCQPGPKLSGIVLTEATSRESLDAAINGWNRLDAQSVEPVTFSGRSYYKRLCTAKPGRNAETLYYATLERVFVLSDHEEPVRRCLSLASDGSSGSLMNSAAFQKAGAALMPAGAARAYVNPRAWDEVLGLSGGVAGSAPGGTSVYARLFAAAWRRCDWLALGLQTDRGVVVEAVGHYSIASPSERWKRFIHSMSGSAEFLRYVPSDAIVVLAGRQAFSNLVRHLLPTQQANESDARSWESFRNVSRGILAGLDIFDDVLPSLRENWGAYIAPRHDAKADEFPIEGLAAIELPSRDSEPKPSHVGKDHSAQDELKAERAGPGFRDAVDNGLNTALNLVAAYFNVGATGVPAVVQSASADGMRVHWIESIGPYQPAVGLTSRFLAAATTPEAVRRFAAAEKSHDAAFASRSTFAPLAKTYFPRGNQILFIDTARLARFVRQHGDQLIHQAARLRAISVDDAEKTLHGFLDVAGLFDGVFVAGHLGDDSLRVVVGGIAQSSPTTSPSAALPVSPTAAPAK